MNHFNCIYMYTNKINGKRYVGQTKDFNRRHKEHIMNSRNKTPIDNAFNKYGEENFEISILKENINTQCLMNFWECYYIEKYNTLSNNKYGYNLSNGGSNGNVFSGKSDDELTEWKNKISESNKGKTASDETKQKMSRIQKERFENKENHPMYGKHHSEESKQKMSESHKGKCKGKERNDMKGNNNPAKRKDVRKKISEKVKGENNGNYNKGRKVAQYNINGELVKIWNNAKQASEQLNIDASSIAKCCRGKCKRAGNFTWRYCE